MRKDLALVVLLIAILALMVIPLPQALIDILLTINISVSILLLMVAVYLKRPSDFTTFPSIILFATAFRLALSIATTRLILSDADAGQIIATFGDFVIRGSVMIGLVIFLIITVVQFVVVTKGAERVAEVAARFTLDAMPGKQMSIEADIRAGTLDKAEGALKRRALDQDSQFFGAMDGAMKFVKGDAIAGILIIFTNLVAGIAVGTSVHGLSLSDAISIYSLLTIGDGLVAQIPALLMALCAGAIVTRVANEESQDLGTEISKELMSDVRVPTVAAGVIFSFGFVPGFPFAAFAGSAALLLVGAMVVRHAVKTAAKTKEQDGLEEGESAQPKDQDMGSSEKTNDRIGLLISSDAADWLDIERVREDLALRVHILSQTYGVEFLAPAVQVSDHIGEGSCFRIEMDEVALEAGSLPVGKVLAAISRDELRNLGIEDDGISVEWVIDGRAYRYVDEKFRSKVLSANAPLVDVETALSERVFRQMERNMRALFGARELSVLLAAASTLDEALVKDVCAQKSNHELTRVFRYLLEDGVPLRPLMLLFESLSSWINLEPKADPVFLAECLRQSMKRQLCQNLASADGELGVSLLSPALQERLMADLSRIRQATGDLDLDGLPLDPSTMDVLLNEARRLTDADVESSRRIAIVTIPQLRRRLRNTLANAGINLPVVSPHEITSEILTFPVNVLGEGFVPQYQPSDKAGSVQPAAGRKSRDRSDLSTDIGTTP